MPANNYDLTKCYDFKKNRKHIAYQKVINILLLKRLHWTVKFLFIAILVVQIIYLFYIDAFALNTSNSNTNTKLPLMESLKYITLPLEMKMTHFIKTSQCQIPYIDPFTPEVMKIFKPSNVTDCTKDNAIVTAEFDESNGKYILHINYKNAMTFIENFNEDFVIRDLECCYRQIERSDSGKYADKTYVSSSCRYFHEGFKVPDNIQGVIVKCSSKSKRKVLQQDAFSFIQVKHDRDYKKKFTSQLTNGPRNLGVLLIGIDSVSRINFRRNMPKTFNYLASYGWYELFGYNKVGENTLPNLLPVLTGYKNVTCNSSTFDNLDDCNFLWTTYRDFGFKTAYAEDTTYLSTFNFGLPGFRKPPTDHYFRPMALAIENIMNITEKALLPYCIGRRQAGEYIYDYALEFATRYRGHANFGFFWTNSFSHQSYSMVATMDGTMKKYLMELQARGILEQSVVVFFSDHGQRWGPLSRLPEGYLEERLPFIFISLPSWLKSQYPDYVKNLKINQRRLTTPFDLHMTLKQLLVIKSPKYQDTSLKDCPSAQSLFQEVPENRTCADACIPELWCSCIPYKKVSIQDVVITKFAKSIVTVINQHIVAKNLTSLCSELSLQKITQAHIHSYDMMQKSVDLNSYIINFTTNPQTQTTTAFSATVKYDKAMDRLIVGIENIVRHSEYENTAKCMNDKQMKQYCICKNAVVKSKQ